MNRWLVNGQCMDQKSWLHWPDAVGFKLFACEQDGCSLWWCFGLPIIALLFLGARKLVRPIQSVSVNGYKKRRMYVVLSALLSAEIRSCVSTCLAYHVGTFATKIALHWLASGPRTLRLSVDRHE